MKQSNCQCGGALVSASANGPIAPPGCETRSGPQCRPRFRNGALYRPTTTSRHVHWNRILPNVPSRRNRSIVHRFSRIVGGNSLPIRILCRRRRVPDRPDVDWRRNIYKKKTTWQRRKHGNPSVDRTKSDLSLIAIGHRWEPIAAALSSVHFLLKKRNDFGIEWKF